MWENFLISERFKRNEYERRWSRSYFWRTYQQQDIDYVEEIDGSFSAWEMKWRAKKKWTCPTAFMEAYKPNNSQVVHQDNFDEFLL